MKRTYLLDDEPCLVFEHIFKHYHFLICFIHDIDLSGNPNISLLFFMRYFHSFYSLCQTLINSVRFIQCLCQLFDLYNHIVSLSAFEPKSSITPNSNPNTTSFPPTIKISNSIYSLSHIPHIYAISAQNPSFPAHIFLKTHIYITA